MHKIAEALDSLSKSINLNPDNVQATFYKGLCLEANEEFYKAMQYFYKAIDIFPEFY